MISAQFKNVITMPAVEALISQAKECLKVLPERAAGIREQKQIDE